MSDAPIPLQPADPQQGWPRVEAVTVPGGLVLRESLSAHPPVVPCGSVSLTRAGWEALVRQFARRYPQRFTVLAHEEIGAAWRRAVAEAGADA